MYLYFGNKTFSETRICKIFLFLSKKYIPDFLQSQNRLQITFNQFLRYLSNTVKFLTHCTTWQRRNGSVTLCCGNNHGRSFRAFAFAPYGDFDSVCVADTFGAVLNYFIIWDRC